MTEQMFTTLADQLNPEIAEDITNIVAVQQDKKAMFLLKVNISF